MFVVFCDNGRSFIYLGHNFEFSRYQSNDNIIYYICLLGNVFLMNRGKISNDFMILKIEIKARKNVKNILVDTYTRNISTHADQIRYSSSQNPNQRIN